MTVKEKSEELNKKYGKICWTGEDYLQYRRRVTSARINAVYSEIAKYNSWLLFTAEEEEKINKIIESLSEYLNYLEEE